LSTYKVKGMQWAALKVKESGQWLLLDSAIADAAVDTMLAAEKEYGMAWASLLEKDFYLVRLNRADDGRPIDLMWAWGQKHPDVPDIRPYDEDFLKINNVVVKEVIGR